MRSSRKRSRRSRSSSGRGLVLFLMVLIFAGSAVLITCQRPAPNARRNVLPRPGQSRTDNYFERRSKDLSRPDESISRDANQASTSEQIPVEEGNPSSAEIPDLKPIESPDTGFLNEFSRGSDNSPKIALTFDAGASSTPTPKILDVLAKHNLHATFFLTGKWLRQNPELGRRIVEEGHEVGNHTYSHKRLTTLSEGDIAKEVGRTEELVLETTGRSAKPLLRVPYGDRDERVLSTLAELGYYSIYWDLDSWDSVKANITSDEIKQRVIGKTRNGSIILMHCGSAATADALDSMLQKLLNAGYEPVSVSELMQESR